MGEVKTKDALSAISLTKRLIEDWAPSEITNYLDGVLDGMALLQNLKKARGR